MTTPIPALDELLELHPAPWRFRDATPGEIKQRIDFELSMIVDANARVVGVCLDDLVDIVNQYAERTQ